SPPPPYSFGQCGTVQPLSRMRSNQTRWASEENLALRPPQKVSLSDAMGLRISGGQLASSQLRVSLRNFSSVFISVLSFGGVSTVKIVAPTLARGPPISISLFTGGSCRALPRSAISDGRQALKNKRKRRCA